MENGEKRYLSHFPQDLIGHLMDIYPKLWSSIKTKNELEVKKYTIIFYQILLDMFDFAGDDDELIMDVGMFGTGYFFDYSFDGDVDIGIGQLHKEIENIFMQELDLPPHHASYGSYDEPKRLAIEKLQQAIKILVEK